MAEVDEDNTAWLAAVVDRLGWPGHRLVGKEGAHNAWLLAQHSDRRPELQRRWLTLLESAVEAGDASPGDLAYLRDRVATAERRPQRYGTQWRSRNQQNRLAPLEDPQRVNEWRKAAGLIPLNESEIAEALPNYPA